MVGKCLFTLMLPLVASLRPSCTQTWSGTSGCQTSRASTSVGTSEYCFVYFAQCTCTGVLLEGARGGEGVTGFSCCWEPVYM